MTEETNETLLPEAPVVEPEFEPLGPPHTPAMLPPPPTPPRMVLYTVGGVLTLLQLGEGGFICDPSTVVHDELKDGPLVIPTRPDVNIGERSFPAGIEVVAGEARVVWGIESVPKIVPPAIPMRNARRILYREGLLAVVESLIASMEGEDGDLARIDWATALTVQRTDPLVLFVIPQLGKSEAEIDQMFIDAAALG